jgi:predicted double-glycine peptidase
VTFPAAKIATAVTLVLLGCVPPIASQNLPVGFDTARASKRVRSLQEIRQTQVVRQRWDLSCGSAALSTLLTHYLNEPVSEAEVVVWLLRRTDPVKIQSRGGFSLLDLKRFAESRGLTAEGYADLSLQDLIELKQPVIVPLRVKGYDHFVIVRGVAGDRVLLADPAFGNLTRSTTRFIESWKGGIGFLVYPRGAAIARKGHVPLTEALLVPDAAFVYRQAGGGGLADPARRPR